MDKAKQQLVQNWLIRARSDLEAAAVLAANAQLDTAVYHCQQSGEKAVKAFLVFCDEPLHRTHDVESLILIASCYDAHFADWQATGSLLTPYATAYRYPSEPFQAQPSPQEFDDALNAAQNLYAFVLASLPVGTHP